MKSFRFFQHNFGNTLEGKIIFDVGANIGAKTDTFLLFNPLKVICVEPDDFNFNHLSHYFSTKNEVIMEKVAISDHNGSAEFFVHQSGSGFNTLSRKWKGKLEDKENNRWSENHQFEGSTTVVTTTLKDLVAKHGIPYFIKIDVEGHEWNVISTLDFEVPILSFEANFPEFEEETILILNHLEGIKNRSRFSVSVDDIGFNFNDLTVDQLIAVIKSKQLRYCEIYWLNN